MKRVAAILFTIDCSLFTASAQNAQVAKIRQLYAAVKQEVENRKKAELPPNEMVVSNNYMAPGAGPIKEEIHYVYDCDYSEEARTYVYTPQFITRRYNVGPRQYYEEMLFDKGSLVFYFQKLLDNETRYYWGPNGFLHEAIKGERETDEVLAAREANRLKAAFDKLMNGGD